MLNIKFWAVASVRAAPDPKKWHGALRLRICNTALQGCGSRLIQFGYGSGSRKLAQSGYGSGSKSSLNLDPIRIHNRTLEDKFFQRLKIKIKKSDISSLCYFYTFPLQKLIKSTKKVIVFLHFLAPETGSGSTKSLNPDPQPCLKHFYVHHNVP
jgi:hypothetical protein